jgi:iron complex outermembrane receptor protein
LKAIIFGRALAVLIAALCIGGNAGPARAQAPTAPAADLYEIPVQPLAAALAQVARQAGLTLVAPPNLLTGKQAPPVAGRLTVREALDRLLAGSGLSARVDGTSIVVQPTAAAVRAAETALPAVVVVGLRAREGFITQGRPATVGKSAISVHENPFTASIVDVQQIREAGALNVQDALTYSAGVYSGRFGFDTRGDWVSIRGLGTSAYIDGLQYLFGFYNNVRPEIYTLQSIEVLKGPSSVLYGQAALGGIVNAVTKRPQAEAVREIDLQLGSYQRKQLAADFTGPLTADGTWLYRVVALARDSNTQVDHVHDDAALLMPALTWRPSAHTSLTLLAIHQTNDTVVSSQFLPSKGTIAPAPLGPLRSSLFVGEPGWDRFDMRKTEVTAIGERRIGDSLRLAGTLRKTKSAAETREHWTIVGRVPDDLGNMPRNIHTADRATDVLAGDVRLEGKLLISR